MVISMDREIYVLLDPVIGMVMPLFMFGMETGQSGHGMVLERQEDQFYKYFEVIVSKRLIDSTVQ